MEQQFAKFGDKSCMEWQYAKLVNESTTKMCKNSLLKQRFAEFEEKIFAMTKLPKMIHNVNLLKVMPNDILQKKIVQKDNSQKKSFPQ